ncbi:hypothetical protein CAEBREN_25823 [Caenorhabditis brenneri]|uniref:Uncharacterized protein n=1 Tax=Caenorhabditis brenneri TaxID=135651 RepID=G0NP87_CAEBE|nr:hypothetical protein CAEBREN_25823 [Caenorhabditis brenneri]
MSIYSYSHSISEERRFFITGVSIPTTKEIHAFEQVSRQWREDLELMMGADYKKSDCHKFLNGECDFKEYFKCTTRYLEGLAKCTEDEIQKFKMIKPYFEETCL